MNLLGILILLIVIGLVWYLVGTLPLPQQIKVVIQVVFILFLILLVLRMFGIVTLPLW